MWAFIRYNAAIEFGRISGVTLARMSFGQEEEAVQFHSGQG